MCKEQLMISAQLMRKEGWKIKDIAIRLGKSERSVYYFLSRRPSPRKKREYQTKLAPYQQFVDSILENEPNFNREVILQRLKNAGYAGSITTLRVYAAAKTAEIEKKAVIRFETEPGLQAQVDWKVFGKRLVNGKAVKLYAFVMVMGYSRMPFVFFTTSMKMSVFLYCHSLAFQDFQGVPREILYDNMKTAWIADNEGVFHPNKKLLGFAHHYGFMPKRCQIRRPQTKGKVERFIDYLDDHFMKTVNVSSIDIDELNQKVSHWITNISDNEIRDLKQSRKQRFYHEKNFLQVLPESHYDFREEYIVRVNRESFIQFETNRYSVPPQYLGKDLTLLVNPITKEAEVLNGTGCIHKFTLELPGQRIKRYLGNDQALILAAWEKQFMKNKTSIREKKETTVNICSPSVYEKWFMGGEIAI